MIVADNTLLCHFFLRSDLEEMARQVRAQDGDWIVPSLWRSEFANAIVKAYWACPDPLELYHQAWDSACAVLTPCEQPVDFHAVVRLGAKHHISAYDAQYVYLAQKFGIPLVTEDVKLQRKFPASAISMAAFLKAGPGTAVIRERRATYRVTRRGR